MKLRKLIAMVAVIAALATPLLAYQEVSEEDYDAAMKSIRATQQGVNSHMEAQNAPELGADGDKFVAAFETVASYWKGRDEAVALELATKALMAARKFKAAGGAGQFDAAATQFGEIRSTCQPCHQGYRERTESGYRIKQ